MNARRLVASGIAFWLIATVGAHALDNEDIAKCAAIADGAKRLQCYDSLAAVNHLNEPETRASTGVGQWRVSTEVSKVDDSTNIYLSVGAESSISGWLKTYTPMITIRCRQGQTEAYIVTGMAGNLDRMDDGTPITDATFRLDKLKAFSEGLSASTDHEALFIPDARGFAKKLLGHDTLLFSFIPFNASSVTTEFRIGGLQETIKPLRAACKW